MSASVKQIHAMAARRVPIAAINLAERYVVMAGGLVLPITEMFDENGDETEDRMEVTKVEAGTDEIGYITTKVHDDPNMEWNQ